MAIVIDPREILSPGITRYKQDYEALSELCNYLVSRFTSKGISIPDSMYRDVIRQVRHMGFQIERAEQGFDIHPINPYIVLGSMAFYEKYWLYDFNK